MGFKEALESQQAREDLRREQAIRAQAIAAAAARLAGNDWARETGRNRVQAIAEEAVHLADYFMEYINTGSIT